MPSNVVPFAPREAAQNLTVDYTELQNVRDSWERIFALASLPNNWDSYGGVAPCTEAVFGAATLIKGLLLEHTPAPHVFPVPNGNIQIEWSCNQIYLEIEVFSDSKCIASFEDLATQNGWEDREFNIDFSDLSAAVMLITQREDGELAVG